MIVLGGDPGAITGLVLARVEVPEPGLVWAPPEPLAALEIGERLPSRCASVARVVATLRALMLMAGVTAKQVDRVAVEGTFFGGNWVTLQHVLRGYFYLEAALEVLELPAPQDVVQSSWKKAWLGRGNLDGKDAGKLALAAARALAPQLSWGGDSACALGVAVASTGYIRADAPKPARSKPKKPRRKGEGTAGAPTSLDGIQVLTPGARARWPSS